MPQSAIEAAAFDYLDYRRGLLPDWLVRAVDEVTREAGTTDHDIYARGVPALTPNPQSGHLGEDAYDLHDCLFGEHPEKRRKIPGEQSLWDVVTTSARLSILEPETLQRLRRQRQITGCLAS